MAISIRSYHDLVVWQKAITLVEEVYQETRSFPKDELFALTNQMKRAAISIPSNIAEGQGRGTTNERLHFLRIARGSLLELETQIIITRRLSYLDEDHFNKLLESAREVGRLINGLIRSLE